ncbi:hypothetical protein ES692_04985 [Psychroserpens burtonensis]|uniref:Uncharacterized protein n=1 Tax=Psychroserpens burtonensis TaxID=49278 RepID=A0A5C7BDP7_9FLAO|nr:hypothetical protein [Psychroserpens burtonensis]TXE18809.1 hypothetical protein ES692_04985 [Psychroserpens burtonensis]
MNLKKSLVITIALSLVLLSSWEIYWRLQGYYPTLNDEKALWAKHRANVETATKEDIIVLGSSRAFFDIQLKPFEQLTGKKLIQLASTGSSPLPTFHDIVNNTTYNGSIIIGVTPGLFFSTTFPEAFPWKRSQSKVNHYQDRTYAQRINYELSVPLQKSFAFVSADEEEWDDDIDLKSLLRQVKIGNRTGAPIAPPFYYFGDVDTNRNMAMTSRTATDTAFANTIIKVWEFFGNGVPPPDKASTMAFFLKDLNTFKARNGNVILVRLPSSGATRVGEHEVLPRTEFWDDLVKQARVKSYHFEDYDTLKDLKCPEESHLSYEDAIYFTKTLVSILTKDDAFTNSKTN